MVYFYWSVRLDRWVFPMSRKRKEDHNRKVCGCYTPSNLKYHGAKRGVCNYCGKRRLVWEISPAGVKECWPCSR